MEYELKYPIELKTEKDNEITLIKTLKFTRLKSKHLKLMPDSLFEKGGAKLKVSEVLPLIAGLANITDEVMGEIDLVDLIKITGEILPVFLSDFQSAEKKGSK